MHRPTAHRPITHLHAPDTTAPGVRGRQVCAPTEADLRAAAEQFGRGATSRRRSRLRRRRSAVALLCSVAVIGLGACSSDDDVASDSTDHAVHATSAPTDRNGSDDGGKGDDSGATVSDGPEEYEVKLLDYSFVGLPERMAAGSSLTVVNESGAELHELVAFKLPDSESRPVSELVQLPQAELMPALGAPVTVLLAAPGGEQIPAVGDGTLAEPGRYAIICTIPTGADPAAYLEAAKNSAGGPPQVAGGPPHIAHGMFAELEVV